MSQIAKMLERGFGLVSINDLISLTYHDDILTVYFEPLPAMMTTPVHYDLRSRNEVDIFTEVHELFTELLRFYYDVVSADLIFM